MTGFDKLFRLSRYWRERPWMVEYAPPRVRAGRYMPHQSAREIARRKGN